MKFFALFAAVLALAAAAPTATTGWTLHELSTAIENPATPAELLPYLEQALNSMMEQVFSGNPVESVVVPTPVGLLPVEVVLEAASPAVVMPVGVVEAPVAPALTTEWTIHDLSTAIQNPATPADLLPYLEDALNSLMQQIFSGSPAESVVVATPVGLLPVEALEAISPAIVMPVGVVEVAPTPINPAPAVVADANGAPLVQIIVNIKSQEAAVPKVNMTTLTMSELSTGIEDPTTNAPCKNILEGVLNDFMDLSYGNSTPYTTGKAVVPTDATTEDLNKAIADGTTKKPYKDVFVRISEKVKSGDLTPQVNDGTWDPKLTPVLVLVSEDK